MTQATVPGYVYTVYTAGGCTVTAPGFPAFSVTCSPGMPNSFPAPGNTVEISDPAATLVAVRTFNGALAALGLLGGGDKLPAGYTRVEYLEGTGEQFLDIPRRWKQADSFRVEFISTLDSPNENVFGTTDAYRLINVPSYIRVMRAGKYYEFTKAVQGAKNLVTIDAQKITVNGKEKAVQAEAWANDAENYKIFTNNKLQFKGKFRLLYFEHLSDTNLILIPALDETGAPCMFDLVTRTPFHNTGTGQFIVGMTLAQVRGLHLPAGGGELTLSLPHEASIDRLAQAALERARANGWVLTLQYAEAEVPAGYRKLDFLESTGMQYIDTGITEYFSLTETISAVDGQTAIVCFVNSTGLALNYWGVHETGQVYLGGAGSTDFYANEPTSITYELTNEFVNFGPTGDSLRKTEVTASKPSQLFLGYGWNPINCFRLHSAQVSVNGALVLNLIPCIAPDGKLGMYNRIDGTVKENAGTGAFIAGLATVDDVRKLWMPETGGTLTVSVPADTPDSAVEQLRKNNPTWQIAIQYRTDNEN